MDLHGADVIVPIVHTCIPINVSYGMAFRERR